MNSQVEEGLPRKGPAPADIRAQRKAIGLSQTAAARIVHSGLRTWQQWEAGERGMHPALWELFQLKTSGAGVTDEVRGQSQEDL